MDERLGKEDWLRAARLALLHHGAERVRVEPLARSLGVTKGSFYWHFRDRRDLLEQLLVEWERETDLLTNALGDADPLGRLPAIIEELNRRNLASERGDSPSDAAIFAWAATDSRVAKRANRAEEERMRLFRRLTGSKDVADLFFYAYHGFLLRRRRVPKAEKDFENIARAALRVFSPKKKKMRIVSSRGSAAAIAGLLLIGGMLQGCAVYRTIRWRDPSSSQPQEIFPQRAVRQADVPFRFASASPQRDDLDTVSVRDVDARLLPFSQYLRERRIKAFVVIRNDTVLYERYRDGYTEHTRSSSFSVAKSFTSALLGLALQSGAIRSLDDSVTHYLPELNQKPDFRGITLENLLEMKSGFAYSRTNGSLWHDFRSSDAKFYYTTDLIGAIASQRREDPPGARWAYKDSDTDLLGWVLTHATGKTIAEQLGEGIWRRIGTESPASWDLDHENGMENVASGLNATARDFARFGRLYLNYGAWNGAQLVSRQWVEASTTLDTLRAEPEVSTWWQMQHNHFWWIPMQNWNAERDFFADGSRGQRIYVNRRLHTVIVQLADESAQDFPFRKIAHYLAGESYAYPKVIVNQLYRAIAAGATTDSVRILYRDLTIRKKADEAGYSHSAAQMRVLADRLEREGKAEMAKTVRALR
jgi:CubicO group peptidase (beta-lactamase class C family)/AcrR family transcriptional regulator